MAKVEIYTTQICPFCYRAKALLDQQGVEYQEFQIDRNPELRAEMLSRSKGGYTVPQIFINDAHVGGCDDLMAVYAKGQLDTLLAS